MAKAPADRPWDAAAVGVTLTELRDKAEQRRARSPWSGPPPSRDQGVAGRRRGAAAAERPPHEAARRTGSRGRSTERDGARLSSRPLPGSAAPTLETALLVLALVAIGGLIAYVVWPPSQEYLFSHAKALDGLDPPRRLEHRARDDYINPLDRRFPDQSLPRANPRPGATRSCSTRPRAGPRSSTSGLKISFSRTGKTDAERQVRDAPRSWPPRPPNAAMT